VLIELRYIALNMTTASRPTFDTAKGGAGVRENDLSSFSKHYSARDLPSHMSLKSREIGQNSLADVDNKDFKAALEKREITSSNLTSDTERSKTSSKLDISSSKSQGKTLRINVNPSNQNELAMVELDADEPLDESGESDSESDDETAALMIELQKIKRERAEEQKEKEQENQIECERIRRESLLSGNPLLRDKFAAVSTKSNLYVKRRWDDDVVFHNCAKIESDKKEKNFINDSLRNEFHRKFMDKYIR